MSDQNSSELSCSTISYAPIQERLNRISDVASDWLMKAVIVYDDIAFAVNADTTLRRVGCRDGMHVQWVVKCWPAKSLNETWMAQKALLESQDAHLVILPIRHAQSVPAWLLDWLNRWAQQRQIRDAALGFIGDGHTADLPQPVCTELSILSREHGLNLIIDDGLGPEESTKHFASFSREREMSPQAGRVSFALLTAPHPYRCMGINE